MKAPELPDYTVISTQLLLQLLQQPSITNDARKAIQRALYSHHNQRPASNVLSTFLGLEYVRVNRYKPDRVPVEGTTTLNMEEIENAGGFRELLRQVFKRDGIVYDGDNDKDYGVTWEGGVEGEEERAGVFSLEGFDDKEGGLGGCMGKSLGRVFWADKFTGPSLTI